MSSNQKSTLGLPSNLSLDSLREILGYFKNDRATLYSLLFVNYHWCKIVIPLLWRQPFDMASLEDYDLIIETYICCLPEKEKSRFILAGVKLPHHPTPFFNYPKYLRSYNSSKFRQALNSWLKMNVADCGFDPLNILCKPIKMLFGPIVKDRYNVMPRSILHKVVNKCIEPIVQDYCATRPNFDVAKEMRNLLLSGCDRLRSLKICYDDDSLSLMEMIDSLCMKNINALRNLQSFELCIRTTMKEDLENGYEILENIFLKIARSATNIQNMKIDVPHIHKFPEKVHIALYKMITSQKNLSSYMSNYCWDSNFSIHSALKNTSLKFLNLWGLTHFDDSLVQGLLKWINLETLELIGCPSSLIPCEVSCNQLNIKNLKLGDGYESYPYIKTTLLQMCNKNLQKLTIEGITSEIIEEITQHCPNITHLSLCAYQDISKSLPKLISNLQNMKVLTLGHHEKFLFTKSTIDQFTQSIPPSLRYLCLNFNISFDFLKLLLEKSQAKLYKLELHQSKTYSDKLVNFLIDYAKNQTQIKLYIPPEHFPHPKKKCCLSAALEVASLKGLKNASKHKHFDIYYKKDNRNFYNLW
ncbi:hypothetical protein RclHR1_01450017 [Rhizophagus clarus]|uniref:F-box domain-containing protein n=1 Tax=Rhizophagus clarus TaxID=94130 RepID=A0A2Z6QQ97_9GLOM|nr:hypothetical protein RclHR1_01450017 [Rhizophagus clarus]